MKIEIHHIPTQGTALQFSRSTQQFSGLKDLIDAGDCNFSAPIEISLTVGPEKDFFTASGRFTTTLRMACNRCLTEFDAPLVQRFRLNYTRKILDDIHNLDSEGIELTAQQIGMYYFEGEEIDFSDAIQEQVILAIPYQPLCQESCKGLCHRCGADWNKTTCQCGAGEDESPFSVLKGLKLKG